MSNEELDRIHEKAKLDVRVTCDENHTHFALNGCLTGDPKAIDICRLCETLKYERSVMSEAAEALRKYLKK